jgi:hypothetical protein
MSASDTQPEPTTHFEAGDSFEISVPEDHDVEKLRLEIASLYGFVPHFHARFGPASVTDEEGSQEYHCPVAAIDDDVLLGKFSLCLPAVGWCVYVGHFKAAA